MVCTAAAPKAYRFDPTSVTMFRMPLLLHLDSSMDIEHSRSRAITRTFVNTWRAFSPDHKVVYRDLYRDPPPHLNDMALHWPPRLRGPDMVFNFDAERLQQNLLDELLAADALLIGAALYNFSLPSTLKSWLDYIHIPGLTAAFTPKPNRWPAGARLS